MKTPEFLFPSTLEVSPVQFKKCLFIGSCLAEVYVIRIRKLLPDTVFDFDLFNNATDLPGRADEELRQYDYQYIQLPIRSILTDAATRILDFASHSDVAELLDVGKRNIESMLAKALAYSDRMGLLTFVSTFIVPQRSIAASLQMGLSDSDLAHVIGRLNHYIADVVRAKSNVFVADVETIAASLGKQHFLDDAIVFNLHGSVYYDDWHHFEGHRIETVPPIAELYENKNDEFFASVFRQIEFLFRVGKQINPVKLVIFDLDNTLWRGLLIEDYQIGAERPVTAGWPLGIWDAVNQLRWRGIAVAIVSKNDEELVVQKWLDAVDPPFIRIEDFIISKINWLPKSENIADIMNQLSLTAKSTVFVDDNPVERAAVKAAFPDIRVIGANPFETKRTLMWAAETQISALTTESRNREIMFKKQIEREHERSSSSHDEFLARLNTRVEIWRVSDINHPSFGRIAELTNKTNQFNTNGHRWGLEGFSDFFKTCGEIFAFSVEDKYTNYGIVGCVFVFENELLQFVMSCRVLGMQVEMAALDVICRSMRQVGDRDIKASILETPANTPCRELYSRSGFELISDNDRKSYRLGATADPKPARYAQATYKVG